MKGRKVFKDSVTPLTDQPGITRQGVLVQSAEARHREEEMTLLFSLAIPAPAQEALERAVAEGKVISAEELARSYGPARADVEALQQWLATQGFHNVKASADGTGVYGSATVGNIEKALAVTMVRVTKDGFTYNAAQDAPSLPADVGSSVHAIVGLQPFRHAHKHSRRCPPRRGNRVAAGGRSDSPSPAINNAPPYLVSELLKAYNADNLGVSGAGQTIAILIDTFPNDQDLTAFWTRNNLPGGLDKIEKINVTGGQLSSPEGEETLDVSWASGIAPGAKVRVYASGSLGFVDLDRALDRIMEDLPSQPGLKQLSISLGLGELYMGGPQGEMAVQHQKFLRLAAAGVNVFISSGDAGSNPDNTGHGSSGPQQVEYGASDTCVVGVGGTSLHLDAGGGVTSETGWAGSGGGESKIFPRPAWQAGGGIPKGKNRLVPDVSLAADPDLGAFLVLNGQVQQIGGTSWSAPVWGGFCALINEARGKAGKPTLPFLNPLIYPLMGTQCFRDISGGSNGAFTAKAGFDMVTGIGVPNVKELIGALTK